MKMRTRIQEQKFGQALGYAWGRKDAPGADTFTLCLDSSAFAAFYSAYEEETGRHKPLQDAYEEFADLNTQEQKHIAQSWARRPWSMYEENQATK